jgi:hypothetical protein
MYIPVQAWRKRRNWSSTSISIGRVAKRTSSRLRRTNDRSVLAVHEDHEDDENAEIGVSLRAPITFCDIWYHAPILSFTNTS